VTSASESNVVTPTSVVLLLQKKDDILNVLIMELTNFVTLSLSHVTGLSSPRSNSTANQQQSLELQDHIQQVLIFFFVVLFVLCAYEVKFVVGRFELV
jgi:hypothetical protein